MRFSHTIAVRAAALLSVAALTLTASPMTAEAVPPTPGKPGKVRTAAEALAKGAGIDVASAQRRLDREARASELAERLTEKLGQDRTAGTWLDADGRLHVAVVGEAAARSAGANGAVAARVKHSQRDLQAITDNLDAAAAKGQIDGIRGWRIDPQTNQVVVESTTDKLRGKAAGIIAREKKAGTVRVEGAKGDLRLAATVYGGREYQINGQWRCSVGFNARDNQGRNVMITAGHCTEGGSRFTYSGATLGWLRGTSFPGNDYGAVTLASGMTPSHLVDMYDGYGMRVLGSQTAPVGATLCKSGRTTGWTCGKVKSLNNTVNYGNGDVVYGLTQHSACVEQGDSGGSNMSGNQAQGLSSGGALYQSGGRLVCGEKVGQPNDSYFQPVGEALSRYNARLITG